MLAILGGTALPVLCLTTLAPLAVARVLACLAARVEHLPEVVQATILEVFYGREVPWWADAVAERSAVPRRTVDRWMARSGLKGIAAILDVAPLARAWSPLVEAHAPHPDGAARLGYRPARMLAAHARRIFGASPAFLGTRLTADTFSAWLAAHALRD